MKIYENYLNWTYTLDVQFFDNNHYFKCYIYMNVYQTDVRK